MCEVAHHLTHTRLSDQIAEVLWAQTSAHDTEAVCDRLGMPPADGARSPMASKRAYVRNRLSRVSLTALPPIARLVVEEYDDDELANLLAGEGFRGVDGELKNLIFAADGLKPRIVLRDAINNVIEIVEGADRCLVYDRSLGRAGLSWGELLDWWMACSEHHNEREAAEALYRRLHQSLASPPEKLVFRQYCRRYSGEDGRKVPALIPQVYLHYDPYTRRELAARGEAEIPRQRMDFLLLPSDRARIVIEVDGKQHYSENSGAASPTRYADMVREDRAIRLDGYEVYRFGGAELRGRAGEQLSDKFFNRLLKRHVG